MSADLQFNHNGMTYTKSKLSDNKTYVFSRENNNVIEYISGDKFNKVHKSFKNQSGGKRKSKRKKKSVSKSLKSKVSRIRKSKRKKADVKDASYGVSPFSQIDSLMVKKTKKSKRRSKKRRKNVTRTRVPTYGDLMCEAPFDKIPLVHEDGRGECVIRNLKKPKSSKRKSKSAKRYSKLKLSENTRNIQDLTPPRMVSKNQLSILKNILGEKAVNDMEKINLLEDIGLLPNTNMGEMCPPVGFPNLSEAYKVTVNGKQTGQVVCRENNPEPPLLSGVPKRRCGKNKEHYVDYLGVGRCRQPVTHGYWVCPPKEDPSRVIHKTLPNGMGICVHDSVIKNINAKDDKNKYLDFMVPFKVMTKNSQLANKFKLFEKLFLGIKLNKTDFELFKVAINKIDDTNTVTNLKMSINNLLVLPPTVYTKVVDVIVGGNKKHLNSPEVAELVGQLKGNLGTYKLMEQILLTTRSKNKLSYLNLVLNHVHLQSDLPSFKVALNSYALNVLRIPNRVTVRESDLAFFGLDSHSRKKELSYMTQYFKVLEELAKGRKTKSKTTKRKSRKSRK